VGWHVIKDVPGGDEFDTQSGLAAYGDAQSVLMYNWMEGVSITNCVSAHVQDLNAGICCTNCSPAYFGFDRHSPYNDTNGKGDGIPDDLEFGISGCIDLTTFDR